MQAVRTTRKRFAVVDARGAELNSGRWHHVGQPVLYCASSLSLSVLEQRVNNTRFDEIRVDFHYADIDLASLEIEKAPESCYQGRWTDHPEKTRDFGTMWVKSLRTPVLEIRSAVLPVESNYLINTSHPDFVKARFSTPRAIPLDDRL
jgi:RES domain-containing protein